MPIESAKRPKAPQVPVAVAAPRRGAPRIGAVRALYHRSFRLFWFNAFFSFGAVQMQQLARSFLARDLTASPLLVTSVFAVGSAPMLVTPLLGGVLADRMDRKRLVLALDIAQTLLSLAFAALLVVDAVNITALMLFGVAAGTVMGLGLPARQSMVPDLVDAESATNGLVLFSSVFNVMQILAPSVSGILIGAAGAEAAFFSTVGLYLVSFPLLMAVPTSTRHVRDTGGAVGPKVLEGFRYVRESKTLSALMAAGILGTVLYFPYLALLPIFQRDVLQEGPSVLGLMFAATGIGALGGSVLLAIISADRPQVGVMLFFSVAQGLAIAAFAQSSTLALSLGLLALVGLAQTGFMTTNMALIQFLTPNDMLGRVLAIRMVVFGLIPVGQILVGLGAEASSPETALAVLGLLGAGALMVMAPLIRRAPLVATIPRPGPAEKP